MLQVKNLCVEVGARLVVNDASFTVMPRDKVGLVGRNGAGKTSLFKVLGGASEPKSGTITRGGAFGYLPQDPRIAGSFDGRSAVSHILSSRGIDEDLVRLEKLRIAMEERADEQNIARFTKAQEAFELKGGYAANSEARAIAAGLGLKPDRLDLQLGVLSGGERRRVELGRILYGGSDTLLLDEPTNHLDLDAKMWMLDFLRTYKGALLVISHDLELLDEAITRVLHLDRPDEGDTGQIIEYRGTYSQYLRSREADEVRAAKMAAQQTKEIDRLQRVVDRFGAKASKAAMARSIEKRIDRLDADRTHAPRAKRTLQVKFPPAPSCGETVLVANGLRKSYGGPDVFHDVSFDLGRGERLLVLGLNGAGKTSLLRILAGESKADDGDFSFGYQVQSGYYAQEHDNLVGDKSLVDHMREMAPARLGLTETQLRGMLGSFGLSGDKVFQESSTLSGGEKTKLALAMLMVGRNNLLLLDEPTNNLDPSSREAVAAALAEWNGAIVLVSHDTEFVEQLAPTKVLVMPDGQVDYYNESWLEIVSLA
ncbi:MAG: ABC transporter ATP-binding protein [Actinobacteria bacterium]|nr:ABC transporter ATP-binding protein [Actinomycetota bacterium]NDC46704.1 ABC transporter ATP-binding protein [Actinomycetota bacterium]